MFHRSNNFGYLLVDLTFVSSEVKAFLCKSVKLYFQPIIIRLLDKLLIILNTEDNHVMASGLLIFAQKPHNFHTS